MGNIILGRRYPIGYRLLIFLALLDDFGYNLCLKLMQMILLGLIRAGNLTRSWPNQLKKKKRRYPIGDRLPKLMFPININNDMNSSDQSSCDIYGNQQKEYIFFVAINNINKRVYLTVDI